MGLIAANEAGEPRAAREEVELAVQVDRTTRPIEPENMSTTGWGARPEGGMLLSERGGGLMSQSGYGTQHRGLRARDEAWHSSTVHITCILEHFVSKG
jgi:hypothetical protein